MHREAASIATFGAPYFLFNILSLSPFSSLQPVVLFETRFEQLKILASRTPSATTSRKIEPPLLAHEKESNDITRLSVTLYYNSTSLLSSNNTKFLKTLSLFPVSQIKGKTKSRRDISPYFTAIYLPHQIFYTYRFTPLPETRKSRRRKPVPPIVQKKIPSNEILLSTERDVTTSPSFSVCRLKWRFNQRRGIITSGIRVSLSLSPLPLPRFPDFSPRGRPDVYNVVSKGR